MKTHFQEAVLPYDYLLLCTGSQFQLTQPVKGTIPDQGLLTLECSQQAEQITEWVKSKMHTQEDGKSCDLSNDKVALFSPFPSSSAAAGLWFIFSNLHLCPSPAERAGASRTQDGPGPAKAFPSHQ